MWDPDGPGPLAAQLVVAGLFSIAGEQAASHVAAWDYGTSTWSPLGTGLNGDAFDVVTLTSGGLVACGEFTHAGGVAVSNIARWDGTSWSALGSGLNGVARTMITLASGDLIVAGNFTFAGGIAASRLARWDGTAWTAIAPGLTGSTASLLELPNGDLVVGGYFSSAGAVVVNNIARWDGASWSAFGSGFALGGVAGLAVSPSGDLFAGGDFYTSGGVVMNGIARWDGTAWLAVGTGFWGGNPRVGEMMVLSNGDLVVGGRFEIVDGVTVNHVARWDGTSWSAMGQGLSVTAVGAGVEAMAVDPAGEIFVGGSFTAVGTAIQPYLARLASTCPATTVSLGGGCNSSGGSNSLTANQPWAGSSWQATGTGLPASAFVVFVNGFSQVAIPLANVLPQGVTGCSLLASADFVELVIVSGGVAQGAVTLPNTPLLAGAMFYSQMVSLEVDQQLNFVAVTSTNALELTIGSF